MNFLDFIFTVLIFGSLGYGVYVYYKHITNPEKKPEPEKVPEKVRVKPVKTPSAPKSVTIPKPKAPTYPRIFYGHRQRILNFCLLKDYVVFCCSDKCFRTVRRESVLDYTRFSYFVLFSFLF